MTHKVHMSLIIETDRSPEDVHLAVLAHLSDTLKVSHSSVMDLDDAASETPTISFVVCPVRGLIRAFVNNEEEASELAKVEGAALVAWSADEDYRNEVTA